MKIAFRDVVEFMFLPVLTSGVFVLWDLNKNVNDLNVRVGIIIATDTAKDKRIEAAEKRLESCEARVQSASARVDRLEDAIKFYLKK